VITTRDLRSTIILIALLRCCILR